MEIEHWIAFTVIHQDLEHCMSWDNVRLRQTKGDEIEYSLQSQELSPPRGLLSLSNDFLDQILRFCGPHYAYFCFDGHGRSHTRRRGLFKFGGMSGYIWACIPLMHGSFRRLLVGRITLRSRKYDLSLLINGMYSVAHWFLEHMVKQAQITQSFLGVQLKHFDFLTSPFAS